MSEIECEFCGEKLQTKSSLNLHRAKTKACIEYQIKKLGKPLSEINKEKKEAEDARIAKKEAEKAKKEAEKSKKEAEKAKKEAKKASQKLKIEAEKEKARKASQKAYREAEEEIARKASQKEIITDDTSDDEIDENAEIPLSSSSEESEEETYKIEEPSTVQEVFNNIENYQRTNPARLNNLFKKKQTTIKTEIIRNDQPPEVHKRKIEEFLPPTSEKVVSSEPSNNIDIKALSEDINKNIEKKITSSIISLENKVNSLLDVIGKVNNSISSLEKRMKSIEPSKDVERYKVEKDVERIMDEKLHEMFYITRKMLAEVESKNDLLDIFRENMEDIIENHYDLYKKFKYIKDDMEDMVYDKGSHGRRR
jgi:hypothetical protein